jgi:hypothetical protein
MDDSLVVVLLVLYFLVTALYYLIFPRIGKAISHKIMKSPPQRKEIEEAEKMVGNWIISILIAILTGIVIVFCNNWITCSVSTCPTFLANPNWSNGWYLPTFMWVIILAVVIVGFVLFMNWIRRMNQRTELVKCPRCHSLIQNSEDVNYCSKCAEPIRQNEY